MHADEAVHADKLGTLLEGGGYSYDPTEFHGPTLYYLTLAAAALRDQQSYLALDEVTLRLVPAIFGVALVAAHLLARPLLGGLAAAMAALLAALSPALVYYSRYFIHETPLVFFSFAALLAAGRYARRPGPGAAALVGISCGLMQATKETAPIAVGCALLAAAGLRLARPPTGADPGWRRDRLRDALVAIGAALAVAGLFFSSFLTRPAGLADALVTYTSWLGRAGAASPHVHPWHYYLGLLLYFPAEGTPLWSEGLILILAGVGAAAGWSTDVIRYTTT
jgi:uncharacterized protein (TIGR03663 family)